MKTLLSRIPQTRLVFYALIIGALPIIIVLFQLMTFSSEVGDLKAEVRATYEAALIREKKQANNRAVLDHYQNSDRFYIDKYIESITLLKQETEALEKIARQNNFIENEAVTNRLNTLKNENRLVFAEGVVQTFPNFTETPESLVRPVEVDLGDLQNILSKVEGIDIGPYEPGPNPPQLIVTDFKIEKKTTGDENEVFSLNLKLVKREFSSEPSSL